MLVVLELKREIQFQILFCVPHRPKVKKKIHDCCFVDMKIPYLIMEYINGHNLTDMVKMHGYPQLK